jgi:outer membrane protein
MRVFVLYLLFFLVSSVFAESIKIGFIDTERVVYSSSLYKEGKANIAEEFESKKQELLDLFNHIELVRAELKKNEQSLNNLNQNKELKNILELETSLQNETAYWQEMINQKQIDLLREIEIIINNALKEFATDENYDLILYENAAFVNDKVDITPKIIEKIESQSQ